MELSQGQSLPQSVHTSIVAFQLIHNVQIIHPVSIAIDASNVCVCPALVADLTLQQAVVDGVLHLGRRRSFVDGLWQAPRVERKVAERQTAELHSSFARQVQPRCNQSGGTLSRCGLTVETRARIAAHSRRGEGRCVGECSPQLSVLAVARDDDQLPCFPTTATCKHQPCCAPSADLTSTLLPLVNSISR